MSELNLDNMDKDVAKTITNVYKHFAKECPELFEHSFVAGGAIRDSVLNRTVKDIDIFVPMKGRSPTVQDSIKTFIMRNCTLAGKEYDDRPEFRVYNLHEDNGYYEEYVYNVQIILSYAYSGAKNLVCDFPISLSRAAFFPMENKMYLPEGFRQSVATQSMFYYSDVSEDYLNRITTKYPEYRTRSI